MRNWKRSERARALVESYMQRECDPRISRVFRDPAVEDRINGAPDFDGLRAEPRMASFVAAHPEGCQITLSLSSLKGVTISISVRVLRGDGRSAECSWRAGSGISFRADAAENGTN